MTPKEKAKQLVEETFCFYLGDDGKGNEYYTDKLECIRAADKCVNEILEFGKQCGLREPMMYWEKVKQEIKKLL